MEKGKVKQMSSINVILFTLSFMQLVDQRHTQKLERLNMNMKLKLKPEARICMELTQHTFLIPSWHTQCQSVMKTSSSSTLLQLDVSLIPFFALNV